MLKEELLDIRARISSNNEAQIDWLKRNDNRGTQTHNIGSSRAPLSFLISICTNVAPFSCKPPSHLPSSHLVVSHHAQLTRSRAPSSRSTEREACLTFPLNPQLPRLPLPTSVPQTLISHTSSNITKPAIARLAAVFPTDSKARVMRGVKGGQRSNQGTIRGILRGCV